MRVVARPVFRSLKPMMTSKRMEGARSLQTFQHMAAVSAVSGVRCFSAKVGSEDSHSDFAPERKAAASVEGDEELTEFLNTAITEHKVLLFMKGVPENPRCGFSAKVVAMLREHNANFSSADVLASDEIREGIKKFSNWPTVPQLYVDGEFIGGCDIVTEMHKNGELEELLNSVPGATTEPPKEA